MGGTHVYGGIEAGGTKFVCVLGTSPLDVIAEIRFPTTTPEETIGRAIAFLGDELPTGGTLAAVGIASFGPVELRRSHPDYGSITRTPKPGWSNTPIRAMVVDALEVPVGFDTDVNGAALAQRGWGAARGVDTFVYVTVGTGIGVGAVVDGRPLHGLGHPEAGHVVVRRQPGDEYPGWCPFHRDCLEGMASGPAIAERWGIPAEDLDGDVLDRAVDLEAAYLAEGLRNVVYAVAPERIIVGGGVAQMPGLLSRLRAELSASLAGYPGLPEHSRDDFVVSAGLSTGAGAAGALALAMEAVGAAS